MKRRDIKPCDCCGRGLFAAGVLCYQVKVQAFIPDREAIQRCHGLELQISPALAAIMGPDEDLLKPVDEPSDRLICQVCALNLPLLALIQEEL